MREARQALRGLLKTPGVALAAIVSIAIGIGATTAIFSVVSALLLRPLPYADADRLVILWNRSPGLNIAEDWFSTAQYFDIKHGHGGFEQLAIAIGSNLNLTGGGDPERIGAIRVSSNLLPMLGAEPASGRLFTADEDVPGRSGTAVLSYGTWMRRYGGDPKVVGASLTLNGQPYEIVGVLPSRFRLPREVLPTLGVAEDGDVFLPLPLGPAAPTVRGREDYNIIGKLKRGVSMTQARADMDTITARLRHDFPDVYPPNGQLTFGIVPLLEQVVGNVRRPLVILLGSVAFVLLIACANVANLLLSRALARRRDIAVRQVLGASRWRIVRQLLTESVVLALLGGALGVAIALLAVQWIHVLQPTNVPRLGDITVDRRVLLFTLAVSMVSGVLFGLAPALGLGRLDLQRQVRESGRGAAGANAVWGRGHHVRRLLVIAELALSVVLLVGAGLLIESFAQLKTVEPGFEPRGVLTLELTMTGRRYADGPAVANAYRELWQRLDQLPGVTSSGGVTSLPLSNYFSWGPITIEGRAMASGENFINADQRVVAGRYFEAMHIPLVRGRLFNETDTPDKPRVIVVDTYMAQEMWPNQDPIGKRLRFGDSKSTAPWQTVVGVVGRVKQYGLETDGRIALYIPHTQTPARALYVVVKGAGEPASLGAVVRRAIGELDGDLPLYHVRRMQQRVDDSLGRQRFSMWLLSIFAATALVLAAIGVYGVVSYLVAQSTREIGIRIALGASQRRILALVVGQGLSVSVAGVAVGLLGATALARLMSSLLFNVRGTDPLPFAATAAVLTAVAFAACYVPARRAARIDPIHALRAE